MKPARAGDRGAAKDRGRYIPRVLNDGDFDLSKHTTVAAIDQINRIVANRCPEATGWEFCDDYIRVTFRHGNIDMTPAPLDRYDAVLRTAIEALQHAAPED